MPVADRPEPGRSAVDTILLEVSGGDLEPATCVLCIKCPDLIVDRGLGRIFHKNTRRRADTDARSRAPRGTCGRGRPGEERPDQVRVRSAHVAPPEPDKPHGDETGGHGRQPEQRHGRELAAGQPGHMGER